MTDKILPENCPKAVCSVTDIARLLSLSRSRFYQLQKQGVFPASLKDSRTGRPYFDLELQQKCLKIRNTSIGDNGSYIIFYNPRKRTSDTEPKTKPQYAEITAALKQMGLSVTAKKVTEAVGTLYPDGLPKDKDQGLIIKELFIHFKQLL